MEQANYRCPYNIWLGFNHAIAITKKEVDKLCAYTHIIGNLMTAWKCSW